MLGPSRTDTRHPAVLAALFGVLAFCFFVFLFYALPTFAQSTALEQFGQASKLPQTELITIIARIIRAFLGILGIIFVILIIYAGYLYLISKGEPAKTDKAKKLISQAVIGFIIIMSSYGIVTFVINAILKGGAGNITVKPPIEIYQEPLSGSLGAGIIENHYPPRDATDIPRNTKIFITFKEAIDPSTIIKNYDKKMGPMEADQSTKLDAGNIEIFETAKKDANKLGVDEVKVVTDSEFKTFVFDPVELLGNPSTDTNYTVALKSGIKKADGKNAFIGAYASGYEWTFEVSTVVDLTPPKVVSVIPKQGATEPKNVIVELTFNEAMDPISSTGVYDTTPNPSLTFTNITINTATTIVEGTYKISNGYKTVGFISELACAQDPCGDTIYCLPGNAKLEVIAKAATIDSANPPQAVLAGVVYDGLTDASGNSLDGNGDGIGAGPLTDNYKWDFSTTNELNDTVPQVVSLNPSIDAQNIDQNAPLQIVFNALLMSSSVVSENVSLWPDPLYPMWFVPGKTDTNLSSSTVSIAHPAFFKNADGGHDYYPVLTQGIKSAYQICMYPAGCTGSNSSTPYCCNGVASATACKTLQVPQGTLPGNIKSSK